MTDFKMKGVASSIINAMGHDEDSQTLRVQFKGGRTYDYAGVTSEMFSQCQGASSVGSHLHKHIKPNCKCTEC
ncbi:hypothetical protein BMS3Bbin02_00102 [bacterium BMS3Bbin02]|nr:hypothetical protein BMS3Bbin02_00102 [bacterium BMS3Bbin02]